MFTKENTASLVDDDTPYVGRINARVRWGVDDLFVKFLASKGAWCHVLDLKFEREYRGWFNTQVTITCKGPKDLVVFWTTTFADMYYMEVENELVS